MNSEPTPPDRRPARYAALLIGGIALLHILVAGRVELSVDGAHYALYAERLSWSYFDHPPMVGWLQALVLPFSRSDLALRLVPIALHAVVGVLVYRLGRRLFPRESPWVAFLALLLLEIGIPFQLIGLAMVPEAPLLAVALGTLLLLVRMTERVRAGDWLLLGVLLGLGGLSKYTAVTLVITTLVALPRIGGLRVLTTPGPWLAVVVAAVLVTPVVAWNHANDWISFTYQIDHGTGGSSWRLGRFAWTQAAQLLAYSPIVYLGGLLALATSWRSLSENGVYLTYAFTLPVLLLFGWNSGYAEGLPHWTALAWAGVTPLLARWLLRTWSARLGVRILARVSAALAGLVLVLVHLLPFASQIPFPDYKHPLGELYGFRDAAAEVARLADEMARTPGPEPGIYIHNRWRASRIAWYGRRPVQVLDDRFDQFDLWFGSPRSGDRGVLLVWDRKEGRGPPSDLQRFERHELLLERPVERAGRKVGIFRYYACEAYRGD